MVIPYELGDVKQMYLPHWDNTQKIRMSKEWLNMSGEGGVVKEFTSSFTGMVQSYCDV